MTDQGPRGDGEDHHWLDRDTEPIPRARYEPEPGRHAAADGAGDDPSEDDPFLDEPTPFSDEADEPPADRPRPSPRRGARRDPVDAKDGEPARGRAGVPSDAGDARPSRDDDLVAAGAGGYRDRGPTFADDDTVFHNFPDDLNSDPTRYGGPAPGGGPSFPVGEPLTAEELGGLRDASTPLVTSRRVVPLEEQPSPLVLRYLFPNEKFRGEWRRHWIALARDIGVAALATVIAGLLAGYLAGTSYGGADRISGVLVIVWLGVVVWAAWKIVDWWFDRFILTSKRVMVVSGVITRNVAMMPLQRVTDMKFVQSALGRVLNYGTFELESAGQDQVMRKIPNLPNPTELYVRIVEEMYEPEQVAERLAGGQDVIDDGT